MKVDKSVQITSIIIVGILIIAIMIITSFNSNTSSQETINSYGEATIDIIPDLVTVYFNVKTSGEDAQSTQEENNKIVEQLTNNLIEQGFNSQDIHTENFYIGPKYNYINGKRTQDGYEATHYLKIEMPADDSVRIGKVINSGVYAGALINYINFELSQEKQNQAKAQAIELAAQDAKTKAQALAQGLGYKIGKLVSVSNSDFGYSPWNVYSSRTVEDIDIAYDEAQKIVASTSIQPGEQTIQASVTAVFKIK